MYFLNTCRTVCDRPNAGLVQRSATPFALLLLTFVIIAVTATSAAAKDFRVNSGYDINDLTPGNGLCVAYLIIIPPFVLPFCTLRGAIEESNSLPGEDSIELPAGTLSLTRAGTDEDLAAEGDLDITDSLTITGKGVDQTFIDANELDRVMDITAANVSVTLKNVTLMNGRIAVVASRSIQGGGALRNRGSLVLQNVVLQQHRVEGDKVYNQGGILRNSGQCSISGSTLQQGKAYAGGAIYNAYGGTIFIVSSTINSNEAEVGAGGNNQGRMTIINSTISGNGDQNTRRGGGFENHGKLSLEHVTVAFNRAESGGGIYNWGNTSLQTSIISNNRGGDCARPQYIESRGYNLDSDDSCALRKQTDIRAVDPVLSELGNHGGRTQTHSLSFFSPARDSGPVAADRNRDQRGVSRPQGKAVDLGAYEFEGFPIPPVIYLLLQDG